MVTDSCPAAQVNSSTAAKADFMPNLPLLKRGLQNWAELFTSQEKKEIIFWCLDSDPDTKVECFMGLNTTGFP